MISVHRTAVIYGDTLFLKGITEILRSLPGLEVIERKPGDGELLFAETQPDVILIDAAQISFPEMEALIESFPIHPCPPFVRLSADGQQLTVYSTQNLPAVTLADLTQALKKICNS
jgi:hypothetical protein